MRKKGPINISESNKKKEGGVGGKRFKWGNFGEGYRWKSKLGKRHVYGSGGKGIRTGLRRGTSTEDGGSFFAWAYFAKSSRPKERKGAS